MGRVLRVAIFISPYHRLYGSQESALQLGRDLPAFGVEPVFLLPGEGLVSEACRHLGAEVHVLRPSAALDVFGGQLLRAPLHQQARLALTEVVPYAWRVRSLLARARVDVLHANESRALLLSGVGARAAGVPALWHVRGDLSVLPPVISDACGRLASRIVFVADALHATVPRRFASKFQTILDGVDEPPERSRRSRRELLGDWGEGALVVLSASSLSPMKGIHHLIEATALARQGGASVRLVLLGGFDDDAYCALLRQRAAELGVTDSVRFVGWEPAPSDWYAAADALCLPTVLRERLLVGGAWRELRCTEGLSRAVLHGMAAGRPVVATRVAGVPEQVVHGETGLVVEPSSAAALADALVALAASPALRLRMGQAGRTLFEQRFQAPRMASELAATYREMADARRPRRAHAAAGLPE